MLTIDIYLTRIVAEYVTGFNIKNYHLIMVSETGQSYVSRIFRNRSVQTSFILFKRSRPISEGSVLFRNIPMKTEKIRRRVIYQILLHDLFNRGTYFFLYDEVHRAG